MSANKKLIIVGGVAGGASAAARARRLSETAEIVMFERGPHISFANCGLPYHIGGVIKERPRLLVQTPESFRKRFNVDVRVRTEVTRIDPAAKKIYAKKIDGGGEIVESYDALLLSPGAEPVKPPTPGFDNPRVFTLRNLSDMDAIIALIERDKPARALVIGGGYIGLEMAEALRERCLDVTLVELLNQVMGVADPEMVTPLHQQLILHGVDLKLGQKIAEVREDGKDLVAKLDSGEEVRCGIIISAIGVRPETKLAKDAGLRIGERGGIVVDEHMRTSDPYIYAVGDAVEVTEFVSRQKMLIPLAGPANRQGRIAADNIFGRSPVYRDTQGTAICKVFDLAIGMTGMSEKALRRNNILYEKIYVHPANHASYYPGAQPLSIKLLFDTDKGRILGAQVVGSDGVDKRVDVLATALRAGLTVYDLEHLELSYAPPYGSAKDPINYAGFVASNVLRGDVKLCHVEDVLSPKSNQLILDVRSKAEVEGGMIPGAINIPIDELRGRLAELSRDKEILVYCQVAMRGYLACRILMQNGFNCRNLTGGYRTYQMTVGKLPAVTVSRKEAKDDAGENIPEKNGQAKGDSMENKIVRIIDACGLQCPGPIMRLKTEMEKIQPGEAISILVTDPGFMTDVPAWCQSTGNILSDLKPEKDGLRAVIVKGQGMPSAAGASATLTKNMTMVVFSGDLDRVMAAFVIANGALAMGTPVTMFFTFWGLNALRRTEIVPVQKGFLDKMFGWMMPRGASKLKLSKMNMGGMGTAMMKHVMKSKNVPSLPELIASAKAGGARMIACTMSMNVMGIHREELIDGLEEGGVAMFLGNAEKGGTTLFI